MGSKTSKSLDIKTSGNDDYIKNRENEALVKIVKQIRIDIIDKNGKTGKEAIPFNEKYPSTGPIFEEYNDIKFITHTSIHQGGIAYNSNNTIMPLSEFKKEAYWKLFGNDDDKLSLDVFIQDNVYKNLYGPRYWKEFEEIMENKEFKKAFDKAILEKCK